MLTHIPSLFFDVVLKEVTTRESHILLYVIVPADVQMYLREKKANTSVSSCKSTTIIMKKGSRKCCKEIHTKREMDGNRKEKEDASAKRMKEGHSDEDIGNVSQSQRGKHPSLEWNLMSGQKRI